MKFCTILLVAALTYGSVAKNLKGGQGALVEMNDANFKAPNLKAGDRPDCPATEKFAWSECYKFECLDGSEFPDTDTEKWQQQISEKRLTCCRQPAENTLPPWKRFYIGENRESSKGAQDQDKYWSRAKEDCEGVEGQDGYIACRPVKITHINTDEILAADAWPEWVNALQDCETDKVSKSGPIVVATPAPIAPNRNAPWGNLKEGDQQSMVCEGPSKTTCNDKETRDHYLCCHGQGGITECTDPYKCIGGRTCRPKTLNGKELKNNNPPHWTTYLTAGFKDCSGEESVTDKAVMEKQTAFAQYEQRCSKNLDCVQFYVKGKRRNENAYVNDHQCCSMTARKADGSYANDHVCMRNSEVEEHRPYCKCDGTSLEGLC